MKNPFGNERNNDLNERKNLRDDSVYEDSDNSMSDLNRKNREKAINVYGDTSFTNSDQRSRGMDNDEMHKQLVGIFKNEFDAKNVIKRLREIGYRNEDITVLAKDKSRMDRLEVDGDNIGKGAVIGGTLGGIAAALPALGVLAVPGIGALLAAGPIVVILSGVIAGGLAGGLVGALTKMGIDEVDAKNYEYQLDQGKIIILVENREDMREEVYMTYRQNNSFVDIGSPRIK